MRTIAIRFAVALAAAGLLGATAATITAPPAVPAAVHARPAGLSWD